MNCHLYEDKLTKIYQQLKKDKLTYNALVKSIIHNFERMLTQYAAGQSTSHAQIFNRSHPTLANFFVILIKLATHNCPFGWLSVWRTPICFRLSCSPSFFKNTKQTSATVCDASADNIYCPSGAANGKRAEVKSKGGGRVFRIRVWYAYSFLKTETLAADPGRQD